MNYTILTSILELLNSSFDNHNNVKFGENFAENLSRHFVFLRFTLLYRNKILVSLLHLDPDPDIMIPYDLYADSVKLTRTFHSIQYTFFYSRKYYEEKMKVFVDDINVTFQWRCYIEALLAIFFKNCYFSNANPKSGLFQNFLLRIANLFHR